MRISSAWKVLALAALVWLAYWNSRDNPFAFDDWHVISQNLAIQNTANIPSFFRDISAFSILPDNRDYRPIFLTSLALAWKAGGGATRPFHLVSISLHAACAILFFLIFRRTARERPVGAGGLAPPEAERVAWLAAALFAVHPLATEPANYISSQSILLADFFLLAAFLAFIVAHGRRRPQPASTRIRLSLVSWASFALALLAKPIAIVLPLVNLLWDLLLAGRRSESPRLAAVSRGLARHLPYVAISVGYVVLRKALMPVATGRGAVFKKSIEEIAANLVIQTEAVVFYYLKLALFPWRLNVDIAFERRISVTTWLAVAVAVTILALLVRFRRQRLLVFWALWFPVGLLITTYVIVLGQAVREARVYLSLMGVCAVAALLGYWLLGALPVKRGARRAVAAVAVAALLVAFTVKTRRQNEVWSSSLSLWENASNNGGTWRAHMNYGLALEAANRRDEALVQLERAVEEGPYAYSHLNLGLAYVNRQRQEEGMRHLRKAVALWPTSPETRLYLGYGLERGGQIEEAEREYQRALRLRPGFVKGHRFLADFYARQGRKASAYAQYQEILALHPANVWARARSEGTLRQSDAADLFRIAFGEQKRGNRQGAIEVYEKLLAVDPLHRQAHFNLGYALLEGGDLDEWRRSVTHFEKVLEIDPGYSEALFRLAAAHWRLGDEASGRRYDRLFVDRTDANPGLKRRALERLGAAQTEGADDGQPAGRESTG